MSSVPPPNAVGAYSAGGGPAMPPAPQPAAPAIFTPPPQIYTPPAPQEQAAFGGYGGGGFGEGGMGGGGGGYDGGVGGGAGGGMAGDDMASWGGGGNEFGMGAAADEPKKPVDQVKAEIMAAVVRSLVFSRHVCTRLCC